VRGLQTDASASGLGAWDVLDVVWEVPDGALWEIAVADGNCSGIAAQTNEAGIASSKTMAAVPTTSAGALRYGVRRGCGRRRSGGFGGICGVGSRLHQHYRNRLGKIDVLRGLLLLTLLVSQGQCDATSRE